MQYLVSQHMRRSDLAGRDIRARYVANRRRLPSLSLSAALSPCLAVYHSSRVPQRAAQE